MLKNLGEIHVKPMVLMLLTLLLALLMTVSLLLPAAKADTALFTENFSDGVADGWVNSGGVWTVESQRYKGLSAYYGENTYSIYDSQVFDDIVMTADIWTTTDFPSGDAVAIYARAQGALVGYCGWKDNSYAYAIQPPFGLTILKFYSGSCSYLQSVPFTLELNTLYHLKAYAVGADLKFKAWKDGDTEPANWQLEYTDTSSPFLTGKIGVHDGVGTAVDPLYYDNIIVYAATSDLYATPEYAIGPVIAAISCIVAFAVFKNSRIQRLLNPHFLP
jgi:hypothetical protein